MRSYNKTGLSPFGVHPEYHHGNDDGVKIVNLPTIKRKVRKASYRKPEAVKELERMADQEARQLHPSCPHLAPRKYSDKTSGGLQKCIVDFLNFSGHQCERISVTGRYIDNSKIVTDVLGFKKRIGSGKWIASSMQKGSADLSSVINGKAVKWEIKMRDKQSPDQVKYQAQIERAGGYYFVVHSLDEFLSFYKEL